MYFAQFDVYMLFEMKFNVISIENASVMHVYIMYIHTYAD